MLFVLLTGLTFLLVVVLAGRAEQREMLQEAPTAVPAVPAAALSDRDDWLANGSLRFAAPDQEVPEGWALFDVTGSGARVYRAAGESYLSLDCSADTCIAGLWQRLDDLSAGDYLFEADVFLQPGGSGGSVSARLGYDATGGVDPTAPEVIWSSRAQATGWQRISLGLEGAGGPGTFFLVLDALSPGADCRVAGVRLLGPPGQSPRPTDPVPELPATATATDVEVRAAFLRLSDMDLANDKALAALIDGLAQARFNVLYLEVRKDGLAYYDSPLEPTVEALSVQDGGGLSWDPLARAVELGHERGLQVHAWVELLPVWPASEGTVLPPAGHMIGVLTEWVGDVWLQPSPIDGRLMADPGHERVRTYLVSLCGDLAGRYAIDGMLFTGMAVVGVEEVAAQDALAALLEQVAGQVRGERPGTVISVVAMAAGPEGTVHGLRPAGAWQQSGAVDAMLVAADDGADGEGAWRAAPPGLSVLPILDGRGSFNHLAAGIVTARKSGALGIVIDDAAELAQAGYWEALAAGPFARPAEVPPPRGVALP